jgi:hypothetical protein
VQLYLRHNKKCTDCGLSDWTTFQCDHVDPSSKVKTSTGKSVRSLKHAGSLYNVREELMKCEVVCTFCHSIRTYSNSDSGKKNKHAEYMQNHRNRVKKIRNKIWETKGQCTICQISYSADKPYCFANLTDGNRKAIPMETLITMKDDDLKSYYEKCVFLCKNCFWKSQRFAKNYLKIEDFDPKEIEKLQKYLPTEQEIAFYRKGDLEGAKVRGIICTQCRKRKDEKEFQTNSSICRYCSRPVESRKRKLSKREENEKIEKEATQTVNERDALQCKRCKQLSLFTLIRRSKNKQRYALRF